MKFFRFLLCCALLAQISAAHAYFKHGYVAPIPPVFGNSVLNADFGGALYNNIAKNFGSGNFGSLSGLTPGTNINADGYPTGVIPTNLAGNVGNDSTYYGHYTTQWTGVGAFNITGPNLNIIVYSGGAGVFGIIPAASGFYFGSPTFVNQASLTTGMNAEWAFGILITSVGTDGGGNVQFGTGTNGAFNFPTGTTVKCGNMTGLGAGPNTDGSWTITNNSSNSVSLQNSTAFAGLVSITGAGGAGVQSECLANVSGAQLSLNFPATVPTYGAPTYTMSGFVLCQTPNLASLNAGHQVQDSVVTFLKAYKPKYLRYMDVMAAQAFYSNFSDINPTTALTYGAGRWVPSYYFGTTTNVADAYSINSGRVGAYQNGEIIQLKANSTTVGRKPTINDNSRGVVPVLSNSFIPLYLTLSGSVTTGDVVSIVFSGQFSYTFNYTVLVTDTSIDKLGASITTALNADPTILVNGLNFGNSGFGNVFGYYVPNLGTLTVTSSTSGAATEVCSPGTFNAVGAFTSASNYTLQYNKVLNAFVQTQVTGTNALATSIPLSIIAEISTRGSVGAWFAPSLTFTQASYQSLGTWVATNLPGLPVMAEVANEVWNFAANPTGQATVLGVALGFTQGDPFNHLSNKPYSDFYGLLTAQMLPAFSSAYVSAGGSRANLQLVTMDTIADGDGGYSNFQMVCCRWNGQDLTGTPGSFTGTITGTTTLTVASLNAGGQVWSSLTLNGSCVTGGTRIVQQTSGSGRGNGVYTITPANSNGSCAMTVTNPAYSAVGGPDGAPTVTAYNAFPTRPIDFMDGVGFATYWGGALANQGSSSWNGTQANYNALFQASANFAAGGSTNITSALNAWDADLNNGTKGTAGGGNTICWFLQGNYTNTCPVANTGGELRAYETAAKVYDGARPGGMANLSVYQYEGGIQQTLAANSVNGTSSSLSPTDLNSQFTSNAWTLSPTYGASNLAVATNIVNLQIAYFNSSQFFTTQLNFWNAMAAIYSDRPNFAPAQFGIVGPQTSPAVPQLPLWGIFPGGLSTPILQNGAAQQFYN